MSTHEDVEFRSRGVTCRAWLFRPAGATGAVPLVVMAHGLGGTRDMSLEPFARAFADAGYAALVFDYRGFGASDGEPRQVLSIPMQREDYRAALAFGRTLPGVDPERIVLWGTSFSGGHAIVLGDEAARGRLPGVVAVVAQCPFTDGPSSVLALGVLNVARVGVRAVADEIGAVLRRKPILIPTAAPGRTAALMMAPDAWPGVQALSPDGNLPPLGVSARIGTRIGLDRPGRRLRRATLPTFVAICEKDSVAPARATRRHAGRGSAAVVAKSYPYGHFDIYGGSAKDDVLGDQLTFLKEALAPS